MKIFPYQRIVVAVDFSAPSKAAMNHALSLAASTGARVDVVHVIEDSFRATLPWDDDVKARVDALREEEFEAAGRKLSRFVPAKVREEVETFVRSGDVDTEVIKFARSRKADLIVAANIGRRRLGRLVLGSTASSIARESHVPVLLVPASR